MEAATCNDSQFGAGQAEDTARIGCDTGQEGSKTAVCLETGEWKLVIDTCIITKIKNLFIVSEVGELLGRTD